jgi:hypothetical protein
MARKRTKSIGLRLSPEEHQVVSAKAKAAGVSASALLRDHLGHTRIYNHRQSERWFATLLSIRRILTALAETAVAFQPADAAITIAYLASIARQMERFERRETEYANQMVPSRDR